MKLNRIRGRWQDGGMALFRKKPKTSPIAEFWAWWRDEGSELSESAIVAGDAASLPRHLSPRVAAIHPGLAWDLSAGRGSHHRLSVTAGGVAELRPIAERWRRSAPAPDAIWEYASALERSVVDRPDEFHFEGLRVPLNETRFDVEVDENAARIHVSAYNPAFLHASHEQKYGVTFLLLDWLLGEDDVERWIGSIEVGLSAPSNPQTGAQLVAAVDALAVERSAKGWNMLEFETGSDTRAIAMVRSVVRWIDYPVFDSHVKVTVPYRDRRDDGLPGKDGLAELYEREAEFVKALGPRGILLLHETRAGRRLFHFYVDSEDQNAADALRGRTSGIHGDTFTISADPGWRDVRYFTG
jgi:hypothetical protein